MKRIFLSLLGLATLAGCQRANEAQNSEAPQSASPPAKSPSSEPPIREMKPAEKVDDSKTAPAPKAENAPTVDELPELAPPAATKDAAEVKPPR